MKGGSFWREKRNGFGGKREKGGKKKGRIRSKTERIQENSDIKKFEKLMFENKIDVKDQLEKSGEDTFTLSILISLDYQSRFLNRTIKAR